MSASPQAQVVEADEDDDYMNMNFGELEEAKHETSIQRRARKQREAEIKARPKSKAEREAEEAAAREAALATSLDISNKGFKMMAKMGFKGGALGKDSVDARIEPIGLSMKEDRGGIGMESEKKRKFREEVERREIDTKKAKVDEGDYRERMRQEREEKRLEGQIIGAMSVAERLDEGGTDERYKQQGGEEVDQEEQREEDQTQSSAMKAKSQPLHSVNVLWRGLARRRLEKERDRRMRHDLQQSLSKLPTYDDPDEDEQYRQALGKEEEELEEEDPALDEFNALEPTTRLAKLVEYLRKKHHYCFWCKFQYPDETMEGCPGITEEDHD